MQLTLSFATLATVLAFIGNSAASPVPEAAIEARKTQFDNYLYACTDANWSGLCENVGFWNEQCTVFPGELQNDVSAVGPANGYICYLYTDYSCTGDGLSDVQYPGIYDLGDGNTNYNDRLNSFICYPPYTGPE